MKHSAIDVRNALVYGYVDSLLSQNDWNSIIRASDNEKEYNQNEFEELICNYILKHAQKPLSIMFSGGVDSTFMLCMALKCFEAKDLRIFTCGFKDKNFDESSKVYGILHELNLLHDHHTVTILFSSLDKVIDNIDDKNYFNLFFSSSLIPCYMGMRAGFNFGNSILTGDGGDELFGGYDRYLWWNLVNKHPWIAKTISRFMGNDINPRSRKFRDIDDYLKQNTIWSTEEVDLIYSSESVVSEPTYIYPSITKNLFHLAYSRKESFGRKLDNYKDMMLYDIGTELFGVESHKPLTALRMAKLEENQNLVSPFMDLDIMKYCVSLPIESKIRGMKRKIALRNSIYDIISNYDKIAGRSKKGFGVPISKWIDEKGNYIVKSNLFETWIGKYIFENLTGTKDHGERLFACYMLAKLVEKGIVEIEE